MRRIHFTRAFVAGVVACLVLGVLAATTLASTIPRTDDSAMRIPVGHVGDRVHYAVFAGNDDAVRIWERFGGEGVGAAALQAVDALQSDRDEPVYLGTRAFEVRNVERVPDAAGVLHESVVVVHNGTFHGPPKVEYNVAEYADLDSRSVFRSRAAASARLGETLPIDERLRADAAIDSLQRHDATLPGLALQGRSLRLGDVLRDFETILPEGTLPGTDRVHLSTQVAGRQHIDGEDTYGVRTDVTARIVVPARDVLELTGSESAAAVGDASIPVTVVAWYVDWVSAGRPYAVLREAGVDFDGGGAVASPPGLRVSFRLVQDEDGETPIPWAPHASRHWVEQREDLERSPALLRRPTDGTGSGLALPLEDALQAAAAGAALSSWLAGHADAVLVGAAYDGDASGGPRWRFLYAQPSSAGRYVQVQRADGDVVSDLGARTVPVFAVDDLPTGPLTIAGARRAWQDVRAVGVPAPAFNHVRWGFAVAQVDDPCGSQPASDPIGVAPARALGIIVAGHRQTPDCSSAGGTYARDAVALDTGSGLAAVAYALELGTAGDRPSGGGPGRDLAAQTWTTTPSQTARFTAPEPGLAAATTIGAAAAFGLVYFWPLLFGKLALIAQYARIQREEVTNHRVRDEAVQLVRRQPGIHASEIARALDVGWGTIVYHLGVLERNKMLTSLVDGRSRRFFPADTIDFGKRGQIAALMNANSRAIYELIAKRPGLGQRDVAGVMQLSIATVLWHLERLEAAGLLGRSKAGRRFQYFVQPAYEPRPAANAPPPT